VGGAPDSGHAAILALASGSVMDRAGLRRNAPLPALPFGAAWVLLAVCGARPHPSGAFAPSAPASLRAKPSALCF